MKTEKSFDVDFKYTLSENITVNLTATVNLLHSAPHYLVTNFRFENQRHEHLLLPDINLVAIKKDNKISWLHFDSRKETLLGICVGRAIEEKVEVEFVNIKNKNGS